MSAGPDMTSAPGRLESGLTGRALRALLAPDAVLTLDGDGCAIRIGTDRRRRPRLRLSRQDLERLLAVDALSRRPGGAYGLSASGYELARAPVSAAILDLPQAVARQRPPCALRRRRHDAVAWLASRRDGVGAPWLTHDEVNAAARLAREHELSLTWPAEDGNRAHRADPAARVKDCAQTAVEPAERRVRAALSAIGSAAPLIVLIVLKHKGLCASERTLRLPRRSARHSLAAGLRRLALHYAQTPP